MPARVRHRRWGRAAWLAGSVAGAIAIVGVTVTTGAADVEIQQLVVTGIRLAWGNTRQAALDGCGATPGWVPVGVDWVDAGLFPASPGDPVPTDVNGVGPRPNVYEAPPSLVAFLCIRQVFARDVAPEAMIPRNLAVHAHGHGCPPRTRELVGPRAHVRVCLEERRAREALAAGQFVADVMTTTEEFYNNALPGWRTLPTSVHVDPAAFVRGAEEAQIGHDGERNVDDFGNATTIPAPDGDVNVGDEGGVSFLDRLRRQREEQAHDNGEDQQQRRRPARRLVFLSLRRPVRPIVSLTLLKRVPVNETYTACDGLDDGALSWEPPGFGYLDTPPDERGHAVAAPTHAVLCVQRSLRALRDDPNVTALVGLVSIRSGDPCPALPGTVSRLVLTRRGVDLCLQWGPPVALTNGTFIADIAIHRTRTAAMPRDDMVPGHWNYLRADLNAAMNGVHGFLFFRKTATLDFYDRLARQEQEPTGGAPASARNPLTGLLGRVVPALDDTKVPRKPPLVAKPIYDSEGPAHNTARVTGLRYRILQLADLHYTGDPNYECREPPPRPNRAAYESFPEQASAILSGFSCQEKWLTEFVETLLDLEQPDFVVFTGDNIHVDIQEDRRRAMDIYSLAVEARGIPWAMIFGNHDETGGYAKEEMLEIVRTKRFAHATRGPVEVDGVGNYELNVRAPASGPWGRRGSAVFRMYFLDSHADIDDETEPRDYLFGRHGYEWIRSSQVEYYKALSRAHHAADRVPAIMFFHIPLPEYNLASATQRRGTKWEGIAAPAVNSGLFSALLEMNDVKATFCGHDHVNDFCYARRGIQLCYGGVTGMGRAYANWGFDRRARVIEWELDGRSGAPRRTLRTWKRFFQDPTQIQQFEVLYQD